MGERDGAERPPDRLHGRRRGRRLRPGRQRLIEERLPALAPALPPTGRHLDPATLFDRPIADLWLEIGFGSGEHLAWQAAHHSGIGMIGCEPFVNGTAALLDRIERDGLDNIRIHPDDGRPLIDALPAESVGRCFILFPDPWPKRRHRLRRFVRPDNLDALARVLKDRAALRLASDDPRQIDWMLLQLRRHPAFRWTVRRAADWRGRPDDWPRTRYEAKALRGQPVYLTFERRRRKPPNAAESGENGCQ
ncbi:MAG: tRNA (guanosine(46)-N7)-methyltransferase TrmB [Inquilinus sp.]|nr:tRNA (guanosine(46)-N7)-methyltransferase TrmB [Inquilinus sp.]